MSARNDDVAMRITNTLQLLTLLGVAWIGTAIHRQTALTEVLIAQDEAMSTTYTDISGLQHTVNTPYRPEGLAEQHRADLISAFCVFTPQNPPKWWNPEECR